MTSTESRTRPPFPVVGVGASAGGLEAFTQLLQRLPADTGLAFVLIQHLDRSHPSLLTEALARTTTMPVHQVEHGMRLEPSHVYVIAPNTDIAIHDGELVVSVRSIEGSSSHLPVDFFLRSLAAELGSRAIGVILSGSASDGTDGLRAIRGADGITFAQAPGSAKFPGMPQSAINAGVVDYTLDITALAAELARLSQHPYVLPQDPQVHDTDGKLRDAVFARVRDAIGVDFSEFKPSTVKRRLARRLALRRMPDLQSYLKLLDAEPDEIRALFEDMLIHVTSFFRDADMFESLRANIFPQILEHKLDGAPVRIWVAGCSTGEEVYSLAIAWLEFASDSGAAQPLQIFGSDLSDVAIEKARLGVYSESAMHGVSDERRRRHFSKYEGGHRIQKRVRDLCVFVRHDLLRDPPFSKLDLVSCRNVLIYFDLALQEKLVPTLHYCLNQPGFLVLGRSENVSGFRHLFSIIDKTSKIFARLATANTQLFAPRALASNRPAGVMTDRLHGAPAESALFAKHLDRLLLARYCPAGVLVNENMDVLLFRGRTGSYLQAAPGQPQTNLIGMARGGLIAALRITLERAKQEMVAVRSPGVEVDQDGSTKVCDVVVLPFTGLPDRKEPLFIVLFEEPGTAARTAELAPASDADRSVAAAVDRRRSDRLELELASTHEYLHTLIEEHGHASAELGTSNEELISGNEELQSMNEELETAKEELQSINEELTTLNDELQTRNHEVTQANSDLVNFALAVDIPILTLDLARRVRRFTPKACSVLNIVPTDVGRRIDDIELNMIVPDLTAQITSVCETQRVKETEIKDKLGHWHRMQIRPHTTTEHTVDGVLLSFVDIDSLKQLVAESQDARAEAERANSAKDDFLATLSHELRTPLSSMLLNAQRLRDGEVVKPAELQRAGESLERATWLQVKLIDDLLDVSRIVAGTLKLECGPVDLTGAIRASIEAVSPSIGEKKLVLDLAIDPDVGLIWADHIRVQQIITNLLTNAVKFTPSGGRLTVAVTATPGFAQLRVTDTGIGIDAEFVPQVFARFSQRDTSITRKYGGLGLGLALVRHLVELHAGNVEVHSAGLGHGAMFSVTFPLAPNSDVKAETPPQYFHALDRPGRALHYDTLAGLRVLIVDDDRRTREAVHEVLRLTGARVELAASAAEGMAAIETFKPQVILCDIAMPVEDGYTFMRKLRAKEADGASTPALALTALAAQDDRRRALAAGFQLHLSKPIDIDRLRDAVLELSKMGVVTKLPKPQAV